MVLLHIFSDLTTRDRHQSNRGSALLGGTNHCHMLVILGPRFGGVLG